MFSKYILYVCVYIYIINIHSTHTYIMDKKTFILDPINHCPALVHILKYCLQMVQNDYFPNRIRPTISFTILFFYTLYHYGKMVP